jgi:hypothetical protein
VIVRCYMHDDDERGRCRGAAAENLSPTATGTANERSSWTSRRPSWHLEISLAVDRPTSLRTHRLCY